ncbi:hypothetical protein [Propionicicella superfundia]|uniref:hypothetical protein n=1 Tax=Propionicicella superfundia TaxID=348582 RepID=UPI00042068F8|nr:hypothetical protein [Propionicicella superfundia]
MTKVEDVAAQRTQLENWLNHVLGLVRRFDQLGRDRQAAYARHRHLYVRYLERWGAAAYFLWVFILTVALTIVAIILFIGIPLATMNTSEDFLAEVARIFLLPFPAALPGALAIVLLRNTRARAINKRRRVLNEQRADQIEDAVRPEIESINAGLQEIADDFSKHVAGRFPEAYLYDEAILFCLTMARNHRASTLTAALNLYETELHNRRMENYAEAQLAELKRATEVAIFNGIMNQLGHAATASAVRAASFRSR